ncbi:MAG: flagellar filament capping protein FliD [Proteobacteria bacterium]|nr:flagellar filament capping protein FliD [Pseudomonadota bacterium]
MDPVEFGLAARPTFGGIATGLDTNALVQQLISVEREPLRRIEARKAVLENQRSLYQDFNTRLLALRDAARAIDNRNTTGSDVSLAEELLEFRSSTTDEDRVTATVTGDATPGNVDVDITQLARASLRRSTTFAAADTVVLTDTQNLTITSTPGGGGGPTFGPISITAGSGGLTAEELVDLINTSTDNADADGEKAMNASLLFDGTDYRLILQSAQTGTEFEYSVSGDLSFDAPAAEDLAQDANITVLGVSVTRGSNTIDDVLDGVTLNLFGTTTSAETLTISADTAAVEDNIRAFTDAYNSVIDFVEGQFQVDSETFRSGPLGGDATLRFIQSQVRAAISDEYTFSDRPNFPFSGLASIGIRTGAGGRIEIDSDTLRDAIENDPTAVRDLFTSIQQVDGMGDPVVDGNGDPVFDEGVATRFTSLLEPLLSRYDVLDESGDPVLDASGNPMIGVGVLEARNDAFGRQIAILDESIGRFEASLAQREQSLLLRFSQLEAAVSALQAQSQFLSQAAR